MSAGLFAGSSVAIVTPMRADGSIDFAAWDRLLDYHVRHETDAIIVGGTTGESATITDVELRELVVAAQSFVRGRARILAGAGLSSTAATIERVRSLSDLGVDGLLVVTPAYVKPTQEGLFRHYVAVAEASAVPVMLYNVPGRTGVDMQPATVARLAAVPQIVAIKEAVADTTRIETLCKLAPSITILSGDDPTACSAILAGAQGVVSVTANVAPQGMARMIKAARAGDVAAARAIDATLAGLHSELFCEPNPIPVKWALERMGLIGPGIRLPLVSLSAEYGPRVEAAIARAGLPLAPTMRS
ncbi:MAG: 4-hydroxy-tetrahydrodipicolinate synthase [Steroidobacteraceae bacterium]|jgi:4-hydroxy-tetrahydrodipicolinate synthase